MNHLFWACRRQFALLVLLLAGPMAHAQAPAWQMAQAVAGSYSNVKATASDASGNVYLVGQFEGTVSFGSISLTSAGAADAFIAKWSPTTSSFVWAQQMGGPSQDVATAITVSGSSIYVAGDFRGRTAVFGTVVLSRPNSYDNAFILKLTDAGSTSRIEWVSATESDGSTNVVAATIAVNGTSVYVAGYFRDFMVSFGNTRLTCSGNRSYDAFVTKLTDAGTAGNFVWAYSMSGYNTEQVMAMAVSGTSVYLVGNFDSPQATFGSIRLSNGAVPPANIGDLFIAKLIDAGSSASFTWAQRAGDTGSTTATALVMHGLDLYITGNVNGTATIGGTAITNGGTFVSKFQDTGSGANFSWTYVLGSPYATSLAVEGVNVYVAGNYSGSLSVGNTTLVSAGNRDIFVVKLTEAGTNVGVAWAKSAGGVGDEFLYSMCLAGSQLYVGGQFSPPAFFDNLTITGSTYTGFLASLTVSTSTDTTSALVNGSFSVFPNPAHRTATVQLPALTGPATLTLVDALGRTIRTETTTSPRHELNLTAVAPGIYALRVQVGEAQAVRRLVVE